MVRSDLAGACGRALAAGSLLSLPRYPSRRRSRSVDSEYRRRSPSVRRVTLALGGSRATGVVAVTGCRTVHYASTQRSEGDRRPVRQSLRTYASRSEKRERVRLPRASQAGQASDAAYTNRGRGISRATRENDRCIRNAGLVFTGRGREISVTALVSADGVALLSVSTPATEDVGSLRQLPGR